MANKSQFYDALVVSVAGGASVKESAAKIGCSLDHAYAISRTAEFRSAVSAIRTEAVEQAVAQITAACCDAIATLRDSLQADRPADRINAAKAILGAFLPMSENLELRRRLEQLEQATQARAA